jgi:hypothetical protein
MNKRIKRKWLEALRSGKYKQGRSELHRMEEGENGPEHKYCCLGVLCDLAEQEGVVSRGSVDYRGEHVGGWKAPGSSEAWSYPPEAVLRWAGLFSRGEQVRVDLPADKRAGLGLHDESGKGINLAWLNDRGNTFEQIADIIEGQL